ncbi:UDP-N-acetylmuramate--L-alanine ligase [Reichenbachiella versicolor]|uniref:UDP-N-acetylmuramate--L-alanine ligase n=1 Tax=Reichenbachiella versicolor TaxID=1821036 RepID=UPI000D6E948B|nr:UDP-N-acetylmuramate--L-alanine ligase [Reichenbachiella versicolor]
MKLENLHSVYFLGIGGIGMSAIARWFHANGYAVSGYDKTPTALTNTMQEEGIEIHFEDAISNIPSEVREDVNGSLIIFTPAIPKDLKLYNHFLDNGYEVYKRSQVLGMLTESKFTIAVAGTHGKTTTSSMVAHILKSAGVDCSAFVGGIMTNYDSNLIIGTKNEAIVVEADEFDRSFLTLHPDIAIITATDADHLDIYGNKDSLKESFQDFIMNIKEDGHLFIEEKAASELDLTQFENINIQTYALESGEITASNLQIKEAKFQFDYQSSDRKVSGLSLSMPGYHNVSNAVAAISASKGLVKNAIDIAKGMASYAGVKRRFEYIINTKNLVMIDDYAHHPEEITALLKSVKGMYPDREITVVFQPHLFTRTRDFMDGFGESLSLADHVLLLDIYPARELPIEGVTSDIVGKLVDAKTVARYKMEDVLEYFDENTPNLVLTVGAGDIDTLVLPIKEKLLNI